ncbi:PREDICTED: uncharacterized protein LOC106819694 [Priapulus caudatus]|uniref:Uncharacterized protein LOC106819694 n=1 Tax=Priapulus caudatus TaxID=37621 RepID=A0ABM1F5Q9_PRICU|nr:PREDICTED: uncharacterized protein LOC106819694 [Priapulus caudatus]
MTGAAPSGTNASESPAKRKSVRSPTAKGEERNKRASERRTPVVAATMPKKTDAGSRGRSRLDSGSIEWQRVAGSLEELIDWVRLRQLTLNHEKPVKGDGEAVEQQVTTHKAIMQVARREAPPGDANPRHRAALRRRPRLVLPSPRRR